MESQKKMKIIAFSFCGISILLIVLVIVLPIIIKNKIQSDYTKEAGPKSDNINLWAKFPGEIKTSIIHTFNILNYSKNNSSKIDSLILEEEIQYDNFNFTKNEKEIFFDGIYKYKLLNQPKNDSIKTLSLGMFETIETLSNPTKYQKGINSLQYLISKLFPNPDYFIRQLFSYGEYKNLITDNVRNTILKNIDKEKADKILNDQGEYALYSFKKISGFYNWVKILSLSEEIRKAAWLTDLFGLTEKDIDLILGENSYLYNYYLDYSKNLAEKFSCKDKNFCGNELLYNQLMTGEVIKSIGLNDILSLFQSIEPEYFPFSKSPELYIYFEEYKRKINRDNIDSKDYIPNLKQLESMINSSSYNCLLSSNNSVLFLSLNKTGDSNKALEIFNISKNILNFMSDYIYDYLPNLFLYQDFYDEKGEIYKIDPISNAYSALTQRILEKTYKLLIETNGLYNLFLSKIVWESLINKLSLINNYKLEQWESDEICPLIMQRALDDGKKVLKVCSDPKTSFNSAESIIKWLEPYYCIISGDYSNCDMNIIYYLKSIIYITDNEIKAIYDQDLLGGIIEENDKLLKEIFNCGEKCNDVYLAKMQFWKSFLTKNLPPPFTKSNTISTIFPYKFPYPIEISYFAEKFGETEEILEKDIDYLIQLCPQGKNILNDKSSKALNSKINLEKNYTLILKGRKEKESLHKLIDLLNNGYLFNNEVTSNYTNLYDILLGNSYEDEKYIKFLSSGQFFENFKPKLNKTTGFNFGKIISKEDETDIQYDRYGIYGKNSDKTMRKIISINDIPILNIKKKEYNYLRDDYSLINSPAFNFQTLIGYKSFIDGFEYETDEDTIYFYDKISSRPFKFNYEDDSDFKDIPCKRYDLDKEDISNHINEENDLNDTKAFLTQKLNKPFIISVGEKELNSKIDGGVSEENYICVDKFTNMVIDSKINFVYSIYTKKYGYINPKIENEKIYPIFTYQRSYEVDIDSYKDYFPKISFFYTFKLIFLIVGIALIIICAIISLWAFIKIHKTIVKEEIQKNEPEKENLINDSRDPTLSRTTGN